jgi:OmpR family response regulator RpaB
MYTILLIDDDEQLAPPLREYFARFDIHLASAIHPDEGMGKLAKLKPDLVILDVMLPERDGFQVCREIRRDNDVPILMLSARGEVMDRIVGLELGADDYLPKPFEPRELVARAQSLLRRTRLRSSGSALLYFDRLTIDGNTQQVLRDGQPLILTTMEYRLLILLAGSPGKPFGRDDILNALKGVDVELYSRSVDILVSRLRQKLKPLEPIKTVWGAGYAFVGTRV